MLQAAATAVGLSLLFVLFYGGTNWLTAHYPVVPVRSWYWTWELSAIPYVPLLLVPYMSLDLLFFAAPFLCRDEQELRALRRRVLFAIITAGVCFLLFPLRLAWPARPSVPGWFGTLVEASCTAPFLMEYPHNLFPALHITLCLIVGAVYDRHTRGPVRMLALAWFGLIALSTVLTWQHHLVDVAGGAMLGMVAIYLFRESAPRLPVVPNVRIGGYYALAAAALVALVPAVWPWGIFLLWPAAALAIVAAGYVGLGPGIFRKSAGRLPLSTQFVLAPVLLGHYLSLLNYRRQCRAWDEVAPGLLVGRTLATAEAREALKQGVTAVLDLTAEFTEAAPFLTTRYWNIPVLDLTAPTQAQLHEATAFLAAETKHGTVYLHCKIGYSRSAAVAGAHLLATGQAATVADAVARLREARPTIVIRPEALEALQAFARGRMTAAAREPAEVATC
jgi:protein-tyrosine phosphatase/membrane-associated phospholipid phosphatase